MKCGVRSVECEDFASSLAEKKAACRGKDTVGTGWRRTIGHLCLGNFRRRLARVYVIIYVDYFVFIDYRPERGINRYFLNDVVSAR